MIDISNPCCLHEIQKPVTKISPAGPYYKQLKIRLSFRKPDTLYDKQNRSIGNAE